MTKRSAVFFDRDGVVNVSPGSGYVLRVADFQLMPGIVDVLAWCKSQGFYTVLVTSQQGVGKGLMSMDDLDAIHDFLQAQLSPYGAGFDRIYSCTELAGQGSRRKPSPEMIFEAASALPIDLAASALVGDHDRTRMGEAIAPPVRRRRTGRQCDSPRISRIGAVERCDHGRIRVEVSPLPLSHRRHRTAGQVAPPSSRGRLPPAYPRAPTLGRLANQRR